MVLRMAHRAVPPMDRPRYLPMDLHAHRRALLQRKDKLGRPRCARPCHRRAIPVPVLPRRRPPLPPPPLRFVRVCLSVLFRYYIVCFLCTESERGTDKESQCCAQCIPDTRTYSAAVTSYVHLYTYIYTAYNYIYLMLINELRIGSESITNKSYVYVVNSEVYRMHTIQYIHRHRPEIQR